jgi:hypothetical protein
VDPFLLLESSPKAIERSLLRRRGLPLRRTWIEQPYGDEEITILEEEVIPAIQQELLQRCELEADRGALAEVRLQMAWGLRPPSSRYVWSCRWVNRNHITTNLVWN